jgi:hypothetical protein
LKGKERNESCCMWWLCCCFGWNLVGAKEDKDWSDPETPQFAEVVHVNIV